MGGILPASNILPFDRLEIEHHPFQMGRLADMYHGTLDNTMVRVDRVRDRRVEVVRVCYCPTAFRNRYH